LLRAEKSESTFTTEYTFFRYEPVMKSHSSGERHDGLSGHEREPACKCRTASGIQLRGITE